GEFSLADREELLRGGQSGPALVPGNARQSLLYQLVNHVREPHMPHNAGKLPAAAVTHLADWIESGAPYDRPLRPATSDAPSWTRKQVPGSAREFWSFRPLHRTTPPAVQRSAWARTPIDRFILEKLEPARIEPNEPATRRQL